MRYLSTFTGIGGFELGIDNAYDFTDDAECVGYSEVNLPAITTYEGHYGHQNFGDITTIDPAELPDFDLLVGGFPCQAFSIAGKRRGFDEARGTLFFDVARIAADKRPRHMVLENVKGLLSHDGGQTIQTIARVLTDLGYRIEWQVLNSKDFGVPQNRERIFIICHLAAECGQQILPIAGANGQSIIQLNQPKMARERIYHSDGVSPTLNTGSGGGAGRQAPMIVQSPRGKNAGGAHEIAPTLTGKSYQDNNLVAMTEARTDEAKAIRRQAAKTGRDFSPRRGKVLVPRTDGVMNTVIANPGKEHLLLSRDSKIRRLTPIECERLQGFPDDWTEGSDTQRYKQCGNAVTVNVVTAVITAMKGVCL